MSDPLSEAAARPGAGSEHDEGSANTGSAQGGVRRGGDGRSDELIVISVMDPEGNKVNLKVSLEDDCALPTVLGGVPPLMITGLCACAVAGQSQSSSEALLTGPRSLCAGATLRALVTQMFDSADWTQVADRREDRSVRKFRQWRPSSLPLRPLPSQLLRQPETAPTGASARAAGRSFPTGRTRTRVSARSSRSTRRPARQAAGATRARIAPRKPPRVPSLLRPGAIPPLPGAAARSPRPRRPQLARVVRQAREAAPDVRCLRARRRPLPRLLPHRPRLRRPSALCAPRRPTTQARSVNRDG
jgi:hypothetical protein